MKNNMTLILIVTALVIISITGCKREAAVIQDTNMTLDTTSINQSISDTLVSSFDNLKLAAYDTPPVPTHNPMPEYPANFRNTGIQGVVVLEVIVFPNGTVSDARVIKSLLAEAGGLDEAAVSAVRKWKFKPALLNKKPVQAKVTIPIPFSLKS